MKRTHCCALLFAEHQRIINESSMNCKDRSMVFLYPQFSVGKTGEFPIHIDQFGCYFSNLGMPKRNPKFDSIYISYSHHTFLRRGDVRHSHLEVFPKKNRPWHHNACAVRDRKCLTVSLNTSMVARDSDVLFTSLI